MHFRKSCVKLKKHVILYIDNEKKKFIFDRTSYLIILVSYIKSFVQLPRSSRTYGYEIRSTPRTDQIESDSNQLYLILSY